MTEVVALATVASCTLFFLIVLFISYIGALGRHNSSTGRDTTKGGTVSLVFSTVFWLQLRIMLLVFPTLQRNMKGRPLSVTRLRPAGNLR